MIDEFRFFYSVTHSETLSAFAGRLLASQLDAAARMENTTMDAPAYEIEIENIDAGSEPFLGPPMLDQLIVRKNYVQVLIEDYRKGLTLQPVVRVTMREKSPKNCLAALKFPLPVIAAVINVLLANAVAPGHGSDDVLDRYYRSGIVDHTNPLHLKAVRAALLRNPGIWTFFGPDLTSALM